MADRLQKTLTIGKKIPKRHGVSCTLIAALAALTVPLIGAPTRLHAEDGRIHVTFLKGGYGSGSGYLFFQGHKYGLGVSSTKVRKWRDRMVQVRTMTSPIRNSTGWR